MSMRISEKHMTIPALADGEMTASLRSSQSRAAYRSPITKWFLAGGLLLFALLLWKTNLESVGKLLWRASYAFPMVFIPYALVIVFETLGWRFAFLSSRSIQF